MAGETKVLLLALIIGGGIALLFTHFGYSLLRDLCQWVLGKKEADYLYPAFKELTWKDWFVVGLALLISLLVVIILTVL